MAKTCVKKKLKIEGAAHLQQLVLLECFSRNVQRKVVRVHLIERRLNKYYRVLKRGEVNTQIRLLQRSYLYINVEKITLILLTTPLTKFRYLGIISWKSSVMNTRRTNSCKKNTTQHHLGKGKPCNDSLNRQEPRTARPRQEADRVPGQPQYKPRPLSGGHRQEVRGSVP